MHDQRIPTSVERDDRTDQAILGLLLDDSGPWAVEEVVRAMGNEIAAQDGLARLHTDGLIHRLDRFVFATRAAARASDLHAA